MNEQELKENLKTIFGIETNNCYPKTSYIKEEIPTIGCFSRELDEDFYFYSGFEKKYYKVAKLDKESLGSEKFNGKDKYQVPNNLWIELEETTIPYTEKDDEHINSLTIRDLYAIIQDIPCSNKSFLNKIIKENN